MHIVGAQLDCARPDPLRARASLRQGCGTAGKARPFNRTPAGPGVFFCPPVRPPETRLVGHVLRYIGASPACNQGFFVIY